MQFVPLKVKSKLKEPFQFVERIQNDAYKKHKAELFDGDLLVHVDFAESYRNDPQNEIQSAYFGNQSFLYRVVILKMQQAR